MDTKKPSTSYGFVAILITILAVTLIAILGFGQSAQGEVPPMYDPATEGNAVTFTGATAEASLLEQRLQEFDPITDFAAPLLILAGIGVGIDFIAMRYHYETKGRIPNRRKRPSVKARSRA